MIKELKQLFCKHSYGEVIYKEYIIEGIILKPSSYVCNKCKKIKIKNRPMLRRVIRKIRAEYTNDIKNLIKETKALPYRDLLNS